MPSTHDPANEKLNHSPMGIYLPTSIVPNAHLFINNTWIGAEQLRQLLKCVPDPDHPRESSPLPPSDMPSETSYLIDFDGYSTSQESDTAPALQKSDTVWDSSPSSRRATNTDLFGPVKSVAYSSAAPPPMTDYQIAAPSMYVSLPRLPLIPTSSPISPTPEPVTAQVD
ncbi:hypothetical protein FB451DRAFT_1389650 [Mycena latifolia]|nr:hypothetical protein FB451DRAFT_1389650 [Mycena latifolia]